jgi:hypothetical protein
MPSGEQLTMGQFDFRLQALLSLRRGRRDAGRAELAAALAVESQLIQRHQRLLEELDREQRRLRAGASRGPVSLAAFQTAARYRVALHQAIAQLAADATQADEATRQGCIRR